MQSMIGVRQRIEYLLARFAVNASVTTRSSLITVRVVYHCQLCENCGRLHPSYQLYINREIQQIAYDHGVKIDLIIFGHYTNHFRPYLPSLGK